MAWVRLDDAFYDHPKFANAGPLAELLWVRALAWSNRNLTDGFIPYVQVRRLGDFDREVAEVNHDVENSDPVRKDSLAVTSMALAMRLCEVGSWREVPGGFAIHDYGSYQRTAAEIQAEAQQRSEAGKKGAQSRWNGKKGPPREPSSKAEPVAPAKATAKAPPIAPVKAPPIAERWRNDAPTPTPYRDSSNEESLPKTELVVVPEPSPPTAAERAKPLTCAFWERQNPKPAVKFIALTKIVERFLEAGWSEEAVSRALDETRAYTVDAITYSLNYRKNSPEAKPASWGVLQRRMAQHQAAEAGA